MIQVGEIIARYDLDLNLLLRRSSLSFRPRPAESVRGRSENKPDARPSSVFDGCPRRLAIQQVSYMTMIWS